MNRAYAYLLAACSCIFAATALCSAASAESISGANGEKPNIVLIIVDTLRADKLGAYGGSPLVSPELDAYAKRGAVLEKVIAQASWTRASLASLFSGRYPREVGVLKEKWDVLPESEVLISENLKAAGYTTIGLTANPQLNSVFGFAQGFDHYRESTSVFGWMKRAPGQAVLDKKNAVRSADDLYAEALKLVKDAGDKPVYLQTLIMEVHAHHRIKPSEVDEDLRSLPDAAYLQSVRNASRSIGKFVTAYEAEIKRPTVFIVTADHGEGLSDHPSVKSSEGHGNLLYTSHIEVPCIVMGPASLVKPGLRIDRVTRLLDLTQTMNELGHAPPLTKAAGVSLAGALRGLAAPESLPKAVFSETRWRKVEKVAVTDGEWLYVENRDNWPGTAPNELQVFRGAQDGKTTDKLDAQRAAASALASELDSIETALVTPNGGAAGADPSKFKISKEAVKQLESLGYLQ